MSIVRRHFNCTRKFLSAKCLEKKMSEFPINNENWFSRSKILIKKQSASRMN